MGQLLRNSWSDRDANEGVCVQRRLLTTCEVTGQTVHLGLHSDEVQLGCCTERDGEVRRERAVADDRPDGWACNLVEMEIGCDEGVHEVTEQSAG